MGHRSSFDRIPKDLYRTWDRRAVQPLLPFLAPGTRYIEPFAGAGDLINQLSPYASCEYASDVDPLAPGIDTADFRAVRVRPGQAVITNPPWTRKLLHEAIVHFSNMGPTWFLFDAAWGFTQQAAPFAERWRRTVVVGRLKWIPGSRDDAKDDAAWYEFGQPLPGTFPTFYPYRCAPVSQERAKRICADCGKVIGQRGRWRLAERQGMVTTVHRSCSAPNTPLREPEAAPLLDWLEGEALQPPEDRRPPGT